MDLIFLPLVVGFFVLTAAVAALFERIRRRVFVYLVAVLFFPERFS